MDPKDDEKILSDKDLEIAELKEKLKSQEKDLEIAALKGRLEAQEKSDNRDYDRPITINRKNDSWNTIGKVIIWLVCIYVALMVIGSIIALIVLAATGMI